MTSKISSPSWIWTAATTPKQNTFVRFRRLFRKPTASCVKLRISADSRYWLYANGRYLGFGPVRSYINHWKFDEYDIAPFLKVGENVVAVLVNHYGASNFQYIEAEAGLWAQVTVSDPRHKEQVFFETDSKWKCTLDPSQVSRTPRISVQESFEEQVDGRLADDWHKTDYDDSGWLPAISVSSSHTQLESRNIPHLTRELILPKRVLRAEAVKPAAQTWTLSLKPYYAPHDCSSNMSFVKGFLFTQIWSPLAQVVKFLRPHHHDSYFKVNGKIISENTGCPPQPQNVALKKGWNRVLIPYPSLDMSADGIKPPGSIHLPQFVLSVHSTKPLQWAVRGAAGGQPWAFIGPFMLSKEEQKVIETYMDYPRIVMPELYPVTATVEACQEILKNGRMEKELVAEPFFQELSFADIVTNDVAASAFADEAVSTHSLLNAEALLSDNAEWATLVPAKFGLDVRLLLDFGREVVGNHVFEIEAKAGTVLDFHNFEFIQPDKRENYADGMNNTFRYICREGRQTFRSLQRRGFQYSWLTVRNLHHPLKIRTIQVEFSTYPQAHRGSFVCDDSLINRIWEVGAHTLRCCAEDTYTDCPTYEQTHWVGDARNEALIDWVINGDPRLWFRCLEQTGQSLETLPMTISQGASAWSNILPAWSFLWMRSCREYLLWTGDYSGASKLLPWVLRNVEGIKKHLNKNGLFEMRAWNMFDWAAMDTPHQGVITHLNCFAAQALIDCAELADWLKEVNSAKEFRRLSSSISTAVNDHLWDGKQKAYIDSIHADGTRSNVFSQQTQTVALISGVANGARGARCRYLVHHPPRYFVKAGSPFFEFFLLELLASENKEQEFIQAIRRDWGFMIEQGASTFWEMWSLKTGRLTRSHCHGWSAAPTFFLSSIVMGVRPIKPGFAEITFAPCLGKLKFVRGVMPTPHGPIEVECHRKGRKVKTQISLPKGVKIRRSTKNVTRKSISA